MKHTNVINKIPDFRKNTTELNSSKAFCSGKSPRDGQYNAVYSYSKKTSNYIFLLKTTLRFDTFHV